MTDDNNTVWNAFTVIFGESKYLSCKWHITCACRRKLKLVPESIKDEIKIKRWIFVLNPLFRSSVFVVKFFPTEPSYFKSITNSFFLCSPVPDK